MRAGRRLASWVAAGLVAASALVCCAGPLALALAGIGSAALVSWLASLLC